MTMHELKLFDEKQIRTVWDEVQENAGSKRKREFLGL